MIWQSASEFWAMGGYGVYVWGSVGVSAAMLFVEVWLTRMGRQHALDAVCEAIDAKALDAGPAAHPEPAAGPSAGVDRPLPFGQGAAT